MVSAAFGCRVAVEVVGSYVTVAGTAVPPPSLSMKAIEAGTTGSLKVAVTGAVTETSVALAAGVFAVTAGGTGGGGGSAGPLGEMVSGPLLCWPGRGTPGTTSKSRFTRSARSPSTTAW